MSLAEEDSWAHDDFEDIDDSEDDYEESSEEESEDDEEDDEDDPERSAKDKGKAREAPEAEHVDQDFDRLVRDIRDGDGNSGALSKVWDFDMKDRETEFKDDLREASGVGKKRGRKPGRQKGVVLSHQVKGLLGEGNQAYMDGDFDECIRIMQEVIRIEPRAGRAWSVLAKCYEDKQEPQKAMQLRIMAAHLNQDADEWERLAEQSRREGYNQQALYCYRKLHQVDPENVGALWERATLAKQLGEVRTARISLLAILKRIPHDLTILAELRPILIELGDLELCAQLFEDAFAHYHATHPGGAVPPAAARTGPDGVAAGFGLMEVLVLADLYNILGRHEQAIATIRRGCRWLQGRASQKFWDSVEDDREWDEPAGPAGESARAVPQGEVQPGMYPLDVNARHRLAVARIKMGDFAEGKMHADIILAQEIADYAALFTEIADAYFEREMYADAGHIYEMLGADAGTSSLYVLLQAAACRRMVGDLKEAVDIYEHVIQADPAHNDAKMKLAEIYEILNEPRKALDLVLQVIDSRRRKSRQDQNGADAQAADASQGASLFEEKPRAAKDKPAKAPRADKLTPAQLRKLEQEKEQEAVMAFGRVRDLWARMLAGDDEADREWMQQAETLIEAFRETRALFLTSRKDGFHGVFRRSGRRKQSAEASEESMASRLQLDLGRETVTRKSKGAAGEEFDSFRKISFADWLRIFMQFSFNLTRRGQYDDAQEILRHILYSNAFQKRVYLDAIRCALITCAIGAGKYDTVVEQARKLVNAHQFNNEPLRVLLASLASGFHATDGFLASTLSKHMLRELRSYDAALKNPDALRWNPVLKRYGAGTKAEEDDDADALDAPRDEPDAGGAPRLPSKENPIGVTIYGQICLAAKSYQSAIFYLLHAYDYCPQDPVICLSLAIASLGRAMQRQADNRHHLITQAMAYLSKYREIRGEDAPDEVEYNFGRAFHHLGLLTLAVKHYQNVLQQAERRVQANPEADCGLAREAAYNLSLIYVTTGATPLAQDLYRRWLSL
ncbi:TPR-like protein [Phanerochaete sordida]|uniref:TPR-like protein n=1 Tax=Phanerochaete sordida TaxID=48140 RepID=A0A9P3LNK1_9APHY|nr:TPR-like protein [Phanerochaete sordida]